MKEIIRSRRSFLQSFALFGAAGMVGTGSVLTSCGGGNEAVKYAPLKAPGTYYIPELPDLANDGKELKAGIIGCGGRGSGAALNFLAAAKGVTITALGDTYLDRIASCAKGIKDKYNIDVPESKWFSGLDNYKQVIDSDVDVVIVASPPFFRPMQFQYAVEKGKHCFLEKPLFVDPVGFRSIMATARQAVTKNLAVVTGTQRHHQRNYVESFKRIMDGMIGEITGGTVYWNQNQLWFRERIPAYKNELEWMIRDWVNWAWLSGDHIVEQHVHNLDVFMWFTGLKPISAVGFGSRQRRVTGDQYDNFSIDFTMENGIHLHSMCRQINGCVQNVYEFIQGTKGSWSTEKGHIIKDLAGNEIWSYNEAEEKETFQQTDPYTLEHVNWINHIRAGKPIDQASETVVPNMAALMGRESAYTGKEITWDEMTTSTMDLTPNDLSYDRKMDLSGYKVPIPGA
jgi:predicted dehydrogenase